MFVSGESNNFTLPPKTLQMSTAPSDTQPSGKLSSFSNVSHPSCNADLKKYQVKLCVPPKDPGFGPGRRKYLKALQSWHRHRASFMICLFADISLLGSTLYHLGFILGFTRADEKPLLDVALALKLSCSLSFGSAIAVAYFHSLPNVVAYGGLLGISRLYIKYPRLTIILARFVALTAFVCNIFTCFLVLKKRDLQFVLDVINLVVLAGGIFFIELMVVVAMNSIIPILKAALAQFSETSNITSAVARKIKQADLQAVRPALRTALFCKYVFLFLGPGAIVVYVICLVLGLRQQYIFFNIGLLSYYLCTSVVVISLVYVVSLSFHANQDCSGLFYFVIGWWIYTFAFTTA